MFRQLVMTLALVAAAGAGGQSQSTKPTAPAATKPAATEADDKSLNLAAYAELLRSDLRTQKIAVITEVMGFTEAEDAAFWPVYRQCDAEMTKLGDERVALIADYAANYDKLTDAIADSLATKALDLESRRHAAKAQCFARVKAALSPKTAMRFLQVDHQLSLLMDLQIAASLPIAK